MKNDYSLLPLATLREMLADALARLKHIVSANASGQAYSLAGRSTTEANLAEINSLIADLSRAIQIRGGYMTPFAAAAFTTPYQDGAAARLGTLSPVNPQ